MKQKRAKAGKKIPPTPGFDTFTYLVSGDIIVYECVYPFSLSKVEIMLQW